MSTALFEKTWYKSVKKKKKKKKKKKNEALNWSDLLDQTVSHLTARKQQHW